MASSYRKHFIPLESDPDVFNKLMHLLGVPSSLRFEDVLSLDGPHALAGPALALVLVLPTTDGYERRKAVEDAHDEDGKGCEHHVVWYPQTINNACGLYAMLHALSNGAARDVLLGGGMYKCLFSCSDSHRQTCPPRLGRLLLGLLLSVPRA